jgi:hypothetical protein
MTLVCIGRLSRFLALEKANPAQMPGDAPNEPDATAHDPTPPGTGGLSRRERECQARVPITAQEARERMREAIVACELAGIDSVLAFQEASARRACELARMRGKD